MPVTDFLSSNIKNVFSNLFSGAKSWVNGVVKSSLTSAVESFAQTAVKSSEEKLKAILQTTASQFGPQSKGIVNSAQAVIEQGMIESNQMVQQVLNKFDVYMKNFRADLDKQKAQGKSADSVFNLKDGEALYKTLSELGKSLKYGKIKLEAFAKQGKSSIENAKPKIEELIGKALVEAIINPILSFFTDLVSSVFKSVFQDLSDGLAKGKPANNQPAAEKEEEEEEEEEEVLDYSEFFRCNP